LEVKTRGSKKLVDAVLEADEILRGARKPSREFRVDATSIKALRTRLELSQAKFATLLDIDLGTLRNWEQGRREPTGPAKALLRAIRNDPEAVLSALAGWGGVAPPLPQPVKRQRGGPLTADAIEAAIAAGRE
jgi:putative transcriptional regulator